MSSVVLWIIMSFIVLKHPHLKVDDLQVFHQRDEQAAVVELLGQLSHRFCVRLLIVSAVQDLLHRHQTFGHLLWSLTNTQITSESLENMLIIQVFLIMCMQSIWYQCHILLWTPKRILGNFTCKLIIQRTSLAIYQLLKQLGLKLWRHREAYGFSSSWKCHRPSE